MAGGGLWAKDSVLQCGEIVRELPVLPQEISFANLSVTFNNADSEFSKLRDATPWKNRPLAVNYGDFYEGAGAMGRIFTGKVQDWTIGGRECHVAVRDAAYDLLTKELTGKLDTATFPNLPNGTAPVVQPIIYGTIESTETNPSDRHGMLPAYLIDDRADRGFETHFWYLVARHECYSVLNVYLDGLRMLPAEYSVEVETFGGVDMTVVKIPKDTILYLSYGGTLVRPSDRTVTVDVAGVKNEGATAAETNPVKQLKHLLKNFVGVADASIDSDVFTAVAAQKEYASHFAVVGSETIQAVSVINGFAQSFNLMTYTGKTGKYSCMFATLSFDGVAQTLPLLTDENDIISGSFRVCGVKDTASRVKYSYAKNYGDGGYEETETEIDTSEDVNLTGEDGPGIEISVELPYVRDGANALAVVMERMSLMREGTWVAEFELPIRYASESELGDFVRVTHWEGPESAGNGFSEVIHRIIALNTSIEPRNMGVKVRALCLGVNQQYAMILGDEDEIAASWDDASAYDKTFAYMGDEDNPDLEPIKMML